MRYVCLSAHPRCNVENLSNLLMVKLTDTSAYFGGANRTVRLFGASKKLDKCKWHVRTFG